MPGGISRSFPDNHRVELLVRSRPPRIFFPLQLTTKRVDAKGPRTSAVLQPLRDPGVCLCALPGKAREQRRGSDTDLVQTL
jgi:hypothetical protein